MAQPQASSFIIRRGFGRIPLVEVPGTGTSGGSSGGMGGSVVTHTEYRDKPLPRIRLTAMSDDEEVENKEIWVIDIKDTDYL